MKKGIEVLKEVAGTVTPAVKKVREGAEDPSHLKKYMYLQRVDIAGILTLLNNFLIAFSN